MSDSPAAILYDSSGVAMAVADGSAIPANTKAVIVAGKEGSNSRFMLLDSSGRPIAVGAGTAGSPAGGVLTVQGVSGGTVLPVKETKNSSASCANVNAAASDTQIKPTPERLERVEIRPYTLSTYIQLTDFVPYGGIRHHIHRASESEENDEYRLDFGYMLVGSGKTRT